MTTTEVENFPGFPDGIMGPDLMMRFRDQATRFGAECVTAKVTRVDLTQSPFGVWVGDEEHRAECGHRRDRGAIGDARAGSRVSSARPWALHVRDL